jgi:hypothetical protein
MAKFLSGWLSSENIGFAEFLAGRSVRPPGAACNKRLIALPVQVDTPSPLTSVQLPEPEQFESQNFRFHMYELGLLIKVGVALHRTVHIDVRRFSVTAGDPSSSDT